MTVRVHVPWDDRVTPPLCCDDKMIEVGWEAQPIADQVKVTWRCGKCGIEVEAFASTYTGVR